MQTDMTYKKKGLMENIVTDQRPGRQQKKKINRYTCRLKSANVEQVFCLFYLCSGLRMPISLVIILKLRKQMLHNKQTKKISTRNRDYRGKYS